MSVPGGKQRTFAITRRVHENAARTGVKPSALRHYESVGLIQSERRKGCDASMIRQFCRGCR
ncbi:MAG: MerR family DNA-binding transcriptional regulator [Pseudomonadota bacterium]